MFVLSSIFCVIILSVSSVSAFPEKGKWVFHIDENIPIIGVTKSLFSQSTISFRGTLLLENQIFSNCMETNLLFLMQCNVQTQQVMSVFHGHWGTVLVGKNTSVWTILLVSQEVNFSDELYSKHFFLINQDGTGSLNMLSSYILSPETIPDGLNYTAVEYVKSPEYIAACDGNNIILVKIVKDVNILAVN